MSTKLRDLLREGDRRTTGRSATAVRMVLRAPQRSIELVAALQDPEPAVRMRAADALEKISRIEPGILVRHKRPLLALLRTTRQQELRWHLAQLLPRLPLTRTERIRSARQLRSYLRDESSIVRTMALQGLFELARATPELRTSVLRELARATRTGTPAMRARARRLAPVLSRER